MLTSFALQARFSETENVLYEGAPEGTTTNSIDDRGKSQGSAALKPGTVASSIIIIT